VCLILTRSQDAWEEGSSWRYFRSPLVVFEALAGYFSHYALDGDGMTKISKTWQHPYRREFYGTKKAPFRGGGFFRPSSAERGRTSREERRLT